MRIRLKDSRSTLITIGLLLLGLLVMFEYPPFWTYGFCLPAARLGALFLGAPCLRAADGYVIETGGLPVQVTLACSAARFFVLLAALCVAAVLKARESATLRHLAPVILTAYVATLLANTARIVLGWYAETLARTILPSGFWSAMHAGVGIFVFLSFLVGTHILVTWRVRRQLEVAQLLAENTDWRSLRDRETQAA